jgi:hypothetical protein
MTEADVLAIEADEFMDRAAALHGRVAAGESISLADAARELGLSVGGFVEIWFGAAAARQAFERRRKMN